SRRNATRGSRTARASSELRLLRTAVLAARRGRRHVSGGWTGGPDLLALRREVVDRLTAPALPGGALGDVDILRLVGPDRLVLRVPRVAVGVDPGAAPRDGRLPEMRRVPSHELGIGGSTRAEVSVEPDQARGVADAVEHQGHVVVARVAVGP